MSKCTKVFAFLFWSIELFPVASSVVLKSEMQRPPMLVAMVSCPFWRWCCCHPCYKNALHINGRIPPVGPLHKQKGAICIYVVRHNLYFSLFLFRGGGGGSASNSQETGTTCDGARTSLSNPLPSLLQVTSYVSRHRHEDVATISLWRCRLGQAPWSTTSSSTLQQVYKRKMTSCMFLQKVEVVDQGEVVWILASAPECNFEVALWNVASLGPIVGRIWAVTIKLLNKVKSPLLRFVERQTDSQ